MNKKLKAIIRTQTGKKLKAVREQGLVPGVIYGKGKESMAVSVNKADFDKLFKEAGENTLIDLEVDKEKPRTVLIHDVAFDPLTQASLHIDFYQVKLDQKVKVEVPLNFIGEAPAVKELNGTLIKSIQSLEIEALPSDLIHEIDVDISKIKTFDDQVTVADIKLPSNVKATADEDETIAVVAPPRTEAEMESLSEDVVEDVDKIEGVAKEEAEEGEAKEKEETKKEEPEAKS